MSLFNMLMGRNPAAPFLLAFLEITQETQEKWPLGRMRDAYTNEDASKIFIFTRNGPSGMGLTSDERDTIEENFRENHPNYVGFEIDDFDQTYLTYEFDTPEQYREQTKEIADMTETEPPMVRFRRLIDDMAAGKKNPAVENAIEAGKKLLGPILDGKSQTVKHGDGSVNVINFTPEGNPDEHQENQ